VGLLIMKGKMRFKPVFQKAGLKRISSFEKKTKV
jgi:hypothetical protein